MSYEQTLANAKAIVRQRDEMIVELKRKRQEIDDQIAELRGQQPEQPPRRGRPRKEDANGSEGHSGAVEAAEPQELA